MQTTPLAWRRPRRPDLHPLLWSFLSYVWEIIWSLNVQNSFQISAWRSDCGCRTQPEFVLQLIRLSNPLQRWLQTTSPDVFHISAMQMEIRSGLWVFSDGPNLPGDALNLDFCQEHLKKTTLRFHSIWSVFFFWMMKVKSVILRKKLSFLCFHKAIR